MSCIVVYIPKDTRNDSKAICGGNPIASKTSNGSGFPVLHAEPEEHAHPNEKVC